VGEEVKQKLRYYTDRHARGVSKSRRLTDLLASDKLPADLDCRRSTPPRSRHDCGSPAMLADTVALLEARGFEEGSSGQPRALRHERAFVLEIALAEVRWRARRSA